MTLLRNIITTFRRSIGNFCLHVKDIVSNSDNFPTSSLCFILGDTSSCKASQSNLCFSFSGKGLLLIIRQTI